MNKDFKEIVLFEIREIRKEVKSLNNFKSKTVGAVAVLLFAFEYMKHTLFK